MTAVLSRPETSAAPPPPEPTPTPRRYRAWFGPGWPIAWAVAAFPLWWALGVVPFVFPVAGAILLWQLRGRRRLVVPPGFWIYLVFLALVVASAVMLNVTAPGTVPPSGFGRFIAYSFRLVDYVAVAVLMLYVVNTPEAVLPRIRVIRWMALLAVWTIALGLVAVAVPRGGFETPFSLLLPSSFDSLVGGAGGGRASLAQLQPVLGVYSPRPAAPFAFTNAWGCTLALLLIWLVVWGWASRYRVRVAVAVVVALSVVPIVYSLDRGVWIGLGLAVVYIAARLALRGRLMAIGALALVLGLGTITFLASPLQTLVSERLQHGHSNDIRSSLAGAALDTAKESPLLGYGSTRAVRGSTASIAVGKTDSCPKCGNAEIGSTGQYFLLLVAQGFLGTGVYVAYFLRTLWAYRRDASPIGLGSTLAILLSLFFGIAYTALIMPLAVVFLSIALLWRNAALRAAPATAGEPAPGARAAVLQ